MLRRKRARSRSEDPSTPTTTIISSSITTAHVSMEEVQRRRRRARCSSNPNVIFGLAAGIGFSSVYFVRTHAQDDDGSAATANGGESTTTILNPVVSADFCRLSPSRKRRIAVPKVSVLCDTPGAYYSGSTAYRNSPVCVAGDKLRLDVLVRIPNGLWPDSDTSSNNSTNAIYVQVEMGLYDRFTTVLQPASLCRMSIVALSNSESSDATVCPASGLYQWTSYYTVPYSLIADATLHYVPDIRLVFSSAAVVWSANDDRDDDTTALLGCVITGPQALRRIHDRRAQVGGGLFGGGCLLLLGAFAVLLSCRQSRRRRQQNVTLHAPASYIRTRPNGQVVRRPLSDEGYGNPAYNETQWPARPVI